MQNPIADYLLPFLDYCEVSKRLADNTQRNYRQYLAVFIGWLEKTGNADLVPADLTAAHVWDFQLYLARSYRSLSGKRLGKRSQTYYLIALRALLDFFTEREISSLPASKVKLGRQGPEVARSFLDRHEAERLLALPDTEKIEGLRDRAIIEVLLSSGMRISELVALDVRTLSLLSEPDWEGRTIELAIVGKGRRVRTAFLSPRACGWLRRYLMGRKDADKALFVNFRSRVPTSRRLSSRAIEGLIGRYARRAGLTKKVTPHTLRHTFATGLLARGADLRSVQELLGHRNVATTQVYTHVTDKRLREVHERFHDGEDQAAK